MSRAWRDLLLAGVLSACGSAQPAPVVGSPPTIAPAARERACFSGTTDNGVCQVFSAAREPLPALASSCRTAGGRWITSCPDEGRVGSCTGADGAHAIYYGLGLGSDALRSACEAEGHTFAPP